MFELLAFPSLSLYKDSKPQQNRWYMRGAVSGHQGFIAAGRGFSSRAVERLSYGVEQKIVESTYKDGRKTCWGELYGLSSREHGLWSHLLWGLFCLECCPRPTIIAERYVRYPSLQISV